jgi:hypothetical protein
MHVESATKKHDKVLFISFYKISWNYKKLYPLTLNMASYNYEV